MKKTLPCKIDGQLNFSLSTCVYFQASPRFSSGFCKQPCVWCTSSWEEFGWFLGCVSMGRNVFVEEKGLEFETGRRLSAYFGLEKSCICSWKTKKGWLGEWFEQVNGQRKSRWIFLGSPWQISVCIIFSNGPYLSQYLNLNSFLLYISGLRLSARRIKTSSLEEL